MVKCSAPLCGNATYRKTPEITFHRFPKYENMKIAWLSKMRRQNWQPTSASVLCSKHFEAHLIDNSGFRTVLAPGAIPTIFDLLQENIAQAACDNVFPDLHKVQPSTSNSTLSQQDVMPTSSIPTSTLKGTIKRSASGHHIFPTMQNVHLSTSTAPSQNNIPTSTITSGEQVLREIQNVQPGVSYKISNDDEDNRRKQEEINKIKHKNILKNKKIKALKQQNRRLKNKVLKFSAIISSLKEK